MNLFGCWSFEFSYSLLAWWVIRLITRIVEMYNAQQVIPTRIIIAN